MIVSRWTFTNYVDNKEYICKAVNTQKLSKKIQKTLNNGSIYSILKLNYK